jgi:hypothetical protein
MKTIVKVAPMYLLVLAGVFFLHYGKVHGSDYKFVELYGKNYGFNVLFTIVFFIAALLFAKKNLDQLSYAYLGFIGLKFIIFFFTIYPDLSEEDPVAGMEGHVFLVPFVVSLLAEVFVLIGLLKDPS